MSRLYHINQDVDIPLYRQLVDIIRAEVQSGKRKEGERLPTVRALAKESGIAVGTVKRAYDELANLGLLCKTRGKGTFIVEKNRDDISRKDRAMLAIDRMFDELEKMDFSASEINIFLNLKIRERAAAHGKIQLALVDCNPEVPAQWIDQLAGLGGLELHTYLLREVERYPYKLSDQVDLVVTTQTHAKLLEDLMAQKEKLVKVALTVSTESIADLIRVNRDARVGFLAKSQKFLSMMENVCRAYAPKLHRAEGRFFGQDRDLAAYLEEKDVLLVPDAFEKYGTQEEVDQILAFATRKAVVSCAYRMDAGSFMYLADRVAKLKDEKELGRAAGGLIPRA